MCHCHITSDHRIDIHFVLLLLGAMGKPLFYIAVINRLKKTQTFYTTTEPLGVTNTTTASYLVGAQF